ncbi:MAG: TY-Chap domain-containing protein [Roseiarcus sp.]
MTSRALRALEGVLVLSMLTGAVASRAEDADAGAVSRSHIEAALTNITTLVRPGQDGLALIFDGNKYVQCRRMPVRTTRCEAGGVLMQPSLGRVLTPARIARLGELGWSLDSSFGNYVRTFADGEPAGRIAEAIVQARAEGYDADIPHLEVQSDWIASRPCPPRNGPRQDRAGSIEDPPPIASGALRGCVYTPPSDASPRPLNGSTTELIDLYGARITGEIQRLRVNLDRDIYVVFATGIGFVQCAPETHPPSIVCEAQSADAWPPLAAVLTPDRVARLHAAGFADPGREPTYLKSYPLDGSDDATIAHELIAILHDVYGYGGAQKLQVLTEKTPR